MWDLPSSSSIPPLPESDFLDVEKDILVSCRLCPSLQLRHADLAAHIKMHDRRNHLLAVSKVERCQYSRGTKKNWNDFVHPDAELVTGFYATYGWSRESWTEEGAQGNLCSRPEAARCALKKATLFASLPYIENQLYTFGDKYISREEQGEFIFIIRGNRKQSCDKGISYFEMTCKDGRYWIRKTMGEDTRVCVNEVILGAVVKTPLAPGDIISIASTNDSFKQDYLFKLKLPTGCQKSSVGLRGLQVVETDEELAHYFCDNNVVLSQVFRRMSVRDILPLRLVTKFWNEEALSLLKTRIVLTPFDPISYYGSSRWWKDETALTQKDSMTIFKLANELGHVDFRKWNIHIPHFSKVAMEKLVDDFRWLFSLDLVLTSHVTHLTLNGLEGRMHESIWEIIDGVAPNLEYLNLRLPKTSPLLLSLLQVPLMPVVTTFILKLEGMGPVKGKDEKRYKEWIKLVFLALPRLRALTLDRLNYQILQLTLEQLVLARQGNNDGRSMPPVGVSIMSNDKILEEPWLNNAHSLPNSPSFYIRDFIGTVYNNIQGHHTREKFYRFLQKWGNSLEVLDLKIDLIDTPDNIPVVEGGPAFCLQFPTPMPRLRHLSLTCIGLSGSDGIRIEVGGRTRFEYCKAFPNLQSLKLCFNNHWGRRLENDVNGVRWEHVAPIYDLFLPHGASLCDTLRVLELPIVVAGQVRRHPGELQRSFPNVASLPAEDEGNVGFMSSFPDFMMWPALGVNDSEFGGRRRLDDDWS